MALLPTIPPGVGVPPLLHPIDTVTDLFLRKADSPNAIAAAPPGVWGLFLDNELVVEPDTFISLDYKNDTRISQYPQEDGAFQHYNKVETPYDLRITMAKSGDAATRGVFFQDCLEASKTLSLYDVITPEYAYTSLNIINIQHSHSQSRGANLMVIELWLQEVRVSASAEYSQSDTQSPPPTAPTSKVATTRSPPATKSAAKPKSVGIVQSVKPTAAEVKSVIDHSGDFNPVTLFPESAFGF